MPRAFTKIVSETQSYLAVIGMVLGSACALAASPHYLYQGTWEGALTHVATSLGEEGAKGIRELVLRVRFENDTISVAIKLEGEWTDVKPGTFQISQYDTNAVVTSITSGSDDDGTWIETWSFAITPIDDSHIDVLWQRQVKNKNMDATNPYAVFGGVAYGELTRLRDP
jgi:hypothetical protein